MMEVRELAPSELAGDFFRNGLVLTGPHPGGSDHHLSEALQVPVKISGVAEPVLAGARALLSEGLRHI
ncbi:hypothetical protein [Streptomyces noursei]|uniref:hypothetical protein n=1 Tax=Streptomyces noursei TaxID=1971 RepID=UPI001673A631|nr:hypothetical protein [Streptomyces noursei]